MDAPASNREIAPQKSAAGSFVRRLPVLLLLMAIIVFTALRPGDAEFANDEPVIVSRALAALEAGQLSDFGPTGTLGQEYGPVTTQFMQLLLLLGGRDLVATMTWRIVLYMTLLAVSLLWLGRALRLSIWFIPVVLVAPPIWYHARLLWDNPWLLPLGVLFMAGYAQCLQDNRKIAPFVVGITGGLMLLTHPMSAAMPIGVGIHALLTQRPALRRCVLFAALGLAISASTSLGYLQRTASLQITKLAVWIGADRPALPPPASDRPEDLVSPNIDFRPARPVAAAAAWTGSTLFSSEHRIAEPGMDTASTRALKVLRWPAALGVILFAVGIVVTWFRRSLEPIQKSLAVASMAVLIAQTFIFGVARPALLPHYHFGAAAATLILCWVGVDLLLKHRAAQVAIAFYGVSLIACTIVVAQSLHRNQGTRGEYGPALNQLIQTAQLAADAGCDEIWTDIPHLVSFPQGFRTALAHAHQRDGAAIGIVAFKSSDGASAALDFRTSAEPLPNDCQLIWRRPN